MDPSIEHDVQMIMDALSLSKDKKSNVARGVEVLRNNDVGPFVSLKVLGDKDLIEYERAGKYCYMIEVTDSSGTKYRLGLAESGLIIALYPPDGQGMGFKYE